MPSVYLTGDKSFSVLFLVILLRYVVLASIAFVIFYLILKKKTSLRKIQPGFPSGKDYLREIFYSLLTAFVFAAIGFAVFATPLSAYTHTYWDIHKYGIPYFILSIVLMILIHDTYFYWTHRLMHIGPVFRIVHRVHHQSTNPSPWAAMAFHPLESVIEGSVIVVIAFLLPAHPLAIGIFLLFMMAYNVYGHLGFELYPRGFSKSRGGRWINTAVSHNQHHQNFKGNYGLYFLWWDRWMGTLDPTYDTMYESVKPSMKS